MRRIGTLLPRTVLLLALAAAAGAVGAVFGRWADGEPVRVVTSAPGADAPAPSSENELAALRATVQAQSEALAELRELAMLEANALVDLSDEMDALQSQLRAEASAPADTSSRVASGTRTAAAHPTESSESLAEDSPESNKTPLFDEQALIDLGVDPYQARELRGRYEKSVLDRLYLRDRAAREGWLRTKRFGLANLKLTADLREEIGSEGYDHMLYASGQRNRLKVTHVLSGSAAEKAGMKPGDVLIAYEGKRIFALPLLRSLTQGGQPGESVTVDIERAGQSRRVNVPRGPLGVTLAATRERPR